MNAATIEPTDVPATPSGAPSYVEDVEIVGHIIDSLILPKVLDEIMALGGRFEIREIRVGTCRNDASYAQLRVIGSTPEHLEELLTAIGRHGAVPLHQQDCRIVPADMDGAFPEGFYATTNQDTQIRLKGTWIRVDRQEMDCGIVLDAQRHARRLHPDDRSSPGDQIVVGRAGTRVLPTERDTAGRDSFGFMNSNVSSEKPKGITVRDVASAMQDARRGSGKILIVAGPAVVHTGSRGYVSHLHPPRISSTCCSRATRWRRTTSNRRCSAPAWAFRWRAAIWPRPGTSITCVQSTASAAWQHSRAVEETAADERCDVRVRPQQCPVPVGRQHP